MVILALIPVVAVAAIIYGKFIKKISKQVQDALASATTTAEEAFSNIRTVRAFSNEEGEVATYGEKVDESYLLSRKRAIAGGIFSVWLSVWLM